ncbi:MAG: hypothetical protein ACO2PN_14490 [Pyrobaculum sp.]
MDRLAEAVAAHLCRHRASACSDSHSTLRGEARRGAVEVVSGARHRDVAAKKRYTPSARGGWSSRKQG